MTEESSQLIRGSGDVNHKNTSNDNVSVQRSSEGNNRGKTKDIPIQGNSESSPLSSLPKSMTFKTSEGDIRIKLRPDLSLPSVQYIQKLLNDPSPCSNCRFYRAEKPGILQGILKKKNVPPNTILGDCPEGLVGKKHDCPAHDPNCGCHGPIMTKGMIAW